MYIPSKWWSKDTTPRVSDSEGWALHTTLGYCCFFHAEYSLPLLPHPGDPWLLIILDFHNWCSFNLCNQFLSSQILYLFLYLIQSKVEILFFSEMGIEGRTLVSRRSASGHCWSDNSKFMSIHLCVPAFPLGLFYCVWVKISLLWNFSHSGLLQY